MDYQSALFSLNKKCQFLIEDKIEDVFIREVNNDGLIKLEKLNGDIKAYTALIKLAKFYSFLNFISHVIKKLIQRFGYHSF